MCCMFIPYTMCVVYVYLPRAMCVPGALNTKGQLASLDLVTLQSQAVHTIALFVLVHEGMLQGHFVSHTRARWFL